MTTSLLLLLLSPWVDCCLGWVAQHSQDYCHPPASHHCHHQSVFIVMRLLMTTSSLPLSFLTHCCPHHQFCHPHLCCHCCRFFDIVFVVIVFLLVNVSIIHIVVIVVVLIVVGNIAVFFVLVAGIVIIIGVVDVVGITTVAAAIVLLLWLLSLPSPSSLLLPPSPSSLPLLPLTG